MNCNIGLSYKGVNCPFLGVGGKKKRQHSEVLTLVVLVASYYTLSPVEVFCDLLELEGEILERTTVS